MSECGLGSPPSGHVTTPIGAIHCFCWPSLSVDVCLQFLCFLEVFCAFLWIFGFCGKASVLTMSSQDKIKKGQRKSVFCGHFMADWDAHHFCPKCRDDLKGDDPCVSSNATDCSVCLSFSEEQRKKIKNRNRYKSKKDQSSSSVGESSKELTMDDSLLDEDDSSVHNGSQRSAPKSKPLEDKLDRFFTQFESISHRLKDLEDKNSGTVGSRTSSDRESVHVTRQPMVCDKSVPPSSSAPVSGFGKRSATITRAEADLQASSIRVSDESGFNLSRKRSFSQSSEDPDPDIEQGEIRSREDDSPAYADTLSTIKKWLDLQVWGVIV